MLAAHVIEVHVADQHRVDLAKPPVPRARDRHPGIVENTGAVGVFKHHGPVQAAELTFLATKPGEGEIDLLKVRPWDYQNPAPQGPMEKRFVIAEG